MGKDNLRQSRALILLAIISYNLTGCFLDSRIQSLSEANNGLDSSTELALLPSTAVLTINKKFSFAATGGLAPYKFSMVSGNGSMNETTGEFTAGATSGTVVISITDAKGKKSQGSISVNPLPTLSNSNFSVFAGSSLTYLLPTPNGGAPDFKYSLFSGIGAVVGNEYLAPALTGTAIVKITDSFNDSVSLNIKVRNFVNKLILSSTMTASKFDNFISAVDLGSYVLTATAQIPVTSYESSAPAKNNYVIFNTTSDNGTTWTFRSSYQISPELSTTASKIIKSGTTLYLLGEAALPNTYDTQAFVSESSDGGVTWSLKTTFQPPTPYHKANFKTGVITTDGSLLLAANSYSPTGSGYEKESYLRKCNLTTWVCANLYTYSSPNAWDAANTIISMHTDVSNNIYYAHQYGNSGGTNLMLIKKSSDAGATWTTLYSPFTGYDYAGDFAVGNDGTTLILTGNSASVGWTRVSNDSGVTWNYIGGSANMSNCIQMSTIVINDTTNAALASCYTFDFMVPSSTEYTIRLSSGATSWTTQSSVTASFGGRLFKKNNGDIFVSRATSPASLTFTSDFGTSFSLRTLPILTVNVDAELNDIVQDSPTTLFSVGFEGTGNSWQRQGTIYRSIDSGDTWTLALKLANIQSQFTGIAKSPTTGTLISVGTENVVNWSTYRSVNGTAWSNTDLHVFAPTQYFTTPKKVLVAADGKFISSGSYRDSTNKFHWFTKISADDGVTFTTLEDYNLASGYDSEAHGGIADGSNFWVVGYGNDVSNHSHWLVRRYDGTTWTVEDDFEAPSGGSLAQARSIFKGSSGTLFVVGEYTDATGFKKWIVRKKVSTPGAVWEIFDTFQASPMGHSSAYNILEDGQGQIFVSGQVDDGGGQLKSMIRVFMYGYWKTVDQSGIFSSSIPQSMIPCLNQQVCLAGRSMNSEVQARGYVRILSP